METPKFTDYNLRSQDVAKLLGYHEQYVRHLALTGQLPAIKRGRLWLFSETELMQKYQKETKDLHEQRNNGHDQNGASDLLQ